MSRAIAEHGLFEPKPSKAETKAEITAHAARMIIGDEAARREANTTKLRQARLEAEAKQGGQAACPFVLLTAAEMMLGCSVSIHPEARSRAASCFRSDRPSDKQHQ